MMRLLPGQYYVRAIPLKINDSISSWERRRVCVGSDTQNISKDTFQNISLKM